MLFEGELCLAPISTHPQRVLDLGTGTGIWAMDFAEQGSKPDSIFMAKSFLLTVPVIADQSFQGSTQLCL
ncbi:MAG: hypothetical protein M1834_008784 [Cirrosporium novae-zelandiae]|nr:MAG: hypothetical protein M1834_008784 [Cirrosporium novae-zelandiae]